MIVPADKLSFDRHLHLVDLLLENYDQFIEDIQDMEDSMLQQFFEMFKDHTSSILDDSKRSTVIYNLVKSSTEVDTRDFRKDKSYGDFSWYSLSWIDLAAAELLKLVPDFSVEALRQRSPYKDPTLVERDIGALRKVGLK